VIQSPTLKPGMIGLAIILLLWTSSTAVCEKSWSGKCVGISDGDTIRVMHGRMVTKIRLYGIDCPELEQDYGSKARRFTGKLAFGKIVTIREMDTDRYGRTVAWVWVDGKSLNKELLKAGLAWWYRYYAPREWELGAIEANARKAKTGLWSRPTAIPPWEFRRHLRFLQNFLEMATVMGR
jgi:endonuclease YncB( thermonuclease family)